MAKHDELFKLIKENPDLEIVPMVCNEVCNSDDHRYWMGEWGKCSVDEYFVGDERVWVREDDCEDLVQQLIDEKFLSEWKGKTEEEMEKLAGEIIDGYSWVKCIVIYIDSM